MIRPTLLLTLAACTGNDPTYYADVKPILDARCGSCHGAGGIGPFPLTTYEEASAVGEIIRNSVETGVMPPWGARPGVQDYDGDPSLTPDQIAILGDWVDAGTPEGDPTEEGPPLDTIAVALPRVDVELQLPVPYEPDASGPDDYRCFITDWPEPDLSYVTGFEVKPDNGSVVHHVAAFLIRPDTPLGPGVFDTFASFDEEEPGPGYTCFGGPSGSEDVAVPIQQVAQWVPGSGATLFPQGTGIAVPPGSQIVIQVHYNTAAWDGAPDQSNIELITTDSVERIGAFAPFLNPLWPLGGMTIPAGQTTTHTHVAPPEGFFELLNPDLDLERGFDIHAAMLHMHNLGQSGSVRLERAGGDTVEILAVDSWDFDWQFSYRLANPITFEPGDQLGLDCTYDNTRPDDANWGEGSDEEMCVANLFISQR